MRHYILEGRTAVLADTSTQAGLLAWAAWFGRADRTVARDKLPLATVSTVFLGLDHNHWAEGPPLLFETMVFAHPALQGELTEFQGRTSSWPEAEAMHAQVMRELLSAHQEAAG